MVAAVYSNLFVAKLCPISATTPLTTVSEFGKAVLHDITVVNFGCSARARLGYGLFFYVGTQPIFFHKVDELIVGNGDVEDHWDGRMVLEAGTELLYQDFYGSSGGAYVAVAGWSLSNP